MLLPTDALGKGTKMRVFKRSLFMFVSLVRRQFLVSKAVVFQRLGGLKTSTVVDADPQLRAESRPSAVRCRPSPNRRRRDTRVLFGARFAQLLIDSRLCFSVLSYASVGSIIGHEVTHAFDDQGEGSSCLPRSVDLNVVFCCGKRDYLIREQMACTQGFVSYGDL